MRSTFHGLETLKRGIYAQQNAIYTTGHNITNANTPGYSRQRVNMVTTHPLDPIGAYRSKNPGQLGTGVVVKDIVRLREAFLDSQFRQEHGRFGEWEGRLDTLQKLEAMMNEPSGGDPEGDTGLGALIDQFWEAWDTLSADPSSNRTVVIESMKTLAEAFNIKARQLNDLRQDLKDSIEHKTDRANELLRQIRKLNEEIMKVEAIGDHANDLLDRRDLLVDELSKLVDIRVDIELGENEQKIYTIVLANVGDDSDGGEDSDENENVPKGVLLKGTELVNELDIKLDKEENEESGHEALIDSGEIGGLLRSIKDVDRYRDELDTLVDTFVQGEVEVTLPAGTVLPEDVEPIERHDDGRITVKVEGVNGLHELGWRWDETDGAVRGGWLFVPAGAEEGEEISFTAENIRVSAALLEDESLLAPSHRDDAPGSNGIARAIASLREESTIRDDYRSFITRLGSETERASKTLKNQTVVLESIDMRRASVSAVSLDEEMVNLIQFQHAYNAAARNMTVIDEMLDRVINGMGRVGR